MITVVSGLPRSGTSLAMQMLHAGGMAILTDGLRQADANNPRGYYEWERIKQLPREPACIDEADGKAVKVISWLLLSLPSSREYRVIFMQRPLEEVADSQAAMIGRLGTQGPALPRPAMIAALEAHLRQVQGWLDGAARRGSGLRLCRVDYHQLLESPLAESDRLCWFLELSLDAAAMAQRVDASLCHQRSASSARSGS